MSYVKQKAWEGFPKLKLEKKLLKLLCKNGANLSFIFAIFPSYSRLRIFSPELAREGRHRRVYWFMGNLLTQQFGMLILLKLLIFRDFFYS